jgi:uncharacterized membrane protein
MAEPGRAGSVAGSMDQFSPRDAPTVPPPSPEGFTPVLERNITALRERKLREQAEATREERFADSMTAFTGSMRSVYLHASLFGGWIAANVGLIPGVPPWDPSFVVLAMIASVEAIFLSTFVLISQNRMAAAADRRADLDLQINLLAEHEVTKLIALVSALAARGGVAAGVEGELDELKQDVAPERVLDELEKRDPQAG